MRLFGTKKAPDRLGERVDQLRDDCDTLLRHMKAIRLEWEETYDKIARLFGRIAKRTAIDNPPPGPPMVPENPPEDGMDDISRSIHQRRKAGKH